MVSKQKDEIVVGARSPGEGFSPTLGLPGGAAFVHINPGYLYYIMCAPLLIGSGYSHLIMMLNLLPPLSGQEMPRRREAR